MQKMQILFIGIGYMGVGMAENILRKNGELFIWNRTKDKPFVLDLVSKGAVLIPDLKEAASKADFICFNLTTDADVKAVMPDVKAGMKEGSILMDFSTTSPKAAVELASVYLEKKSFYLDSPVSGGPEGAKAGTLAIMVGGDAEAFKKALPIFEMCGNNIQHMGPSGLGQKSKLVGHCLTWGNLAAVCEAMLLARKAGINLESLYKIVLTSWGRSWMFESSVARYIIPMDFDAPASFGTNMKKDYNLLFDMAREAGCELPIASVAKRTYEQAIEEGLGKNHPSVIIKVMEKNNITEPGAGKK